MNLVLLVFSTHLNLLPSSFVKLNLTFSLSSINYCSTSTTCLLDDSIRLDVFGYRQHDIFALKVRSWRGVRRPIVLLVIPLRPIEPPNRVARPKIIKVACNHLLSRTQNRELLGGRLGIGQLSARARAETDAKKDDCESHRSCPCA